MAETDSSGTRRTWVRPVATVLGPLAVLALTAGLYVTLNGTPVPTPDLARKPSPVDAREPVETRPAEAPAPPNPVNAAARAAADAACIAGKADACAELADQEYVGSGGPKDVAAAVRHADLACEANGSYCWNAAEYDEVARWEVCAQEIHRVARAGRHDPAPPCAEELGTLSGQLAKVRAQYAKACSMGRQLAPACSYLTTIDGGHEREALKRACNFHHVPNFEGACWRLNFLEWIQPAR